MPPEPVPWDRKDFVFKDRKHERGAGSDALGGGSSSSTTRWREPYHGPRDFPRASPRRPPPGQYRQSGGYHQLYPENSGAHGCTPSRSDRFWLEDEGFRPSSGRYGGGGGRSSSGGSRESRGSFRRSPYWDSSDSSRQQHHDPPVTAQRSVAVPISPASQPPLKDQNDKTGGGVDDGSGTGHRFDRDHSLGSISWKPLKWSRAGSLSSTKAGRSELEETGLEVLIPTGKETPIRSPVTSPAPSDEGASKKKPRLGWGQGLAKYEKQKVEGSLDASGTAAKDALNETSPKVVGLAGCPSPATPGSVTCSSSPAGIEEKPCVKVVNGDNDTSHYRDPAEELSIKLGHMEGNPINILTALLADLWQPDDASMGDSTFSRQTAMNKLLLFKEDISRELEKTECEIDLFENELKSLDGDPENDPHQSSFTSPANTAPEPCIESSNVASKDSNLSKGHEFTSSAVTLVENNALPTDACDAEIKGVDLDSPQTVSSRFNNSASSRKGVCDHETEQLAECLEIVENHRFKVSEIQHSVLSDDVERPATVCDNGDGSRGEAGSSSDNGNFEASLHGRTDCNLITLIMASNRDAANKASQVFHKALLTSPPQLDVWGSDKLLSYRQNDFRIKEKLAIHKQLLKFKERVLTLKFRALHHLWKEDLRLLSIRKHRTKSSRRFELSSRASQGGSQKQRCSIRSRFALPAGNLTLVPTTEIVEFTSKLLSDSQIKLYRNNLKMPALILDENGRKQTKFITHNGLIEDPISFEKERAMINPWTQGEKEVFMEMLATFGKDFTKISSFLNHKTTADCIEFYYKNHKSESFREVKKRLNLNKQWQRLPTSSYLGTSGKKWNREVNAASLDMLGAASVVAAHSNGNATSQQRYSGHGAHDGLKVSCGSYGSLERVSNVETPGHERETVAAGVLVGICGALEAVSSCITSSIDPVEKMNYMAKEWPLTPEVTQNFDEDDTCSDEGCGELDSADWTDEEKSMFIRALSMYGKDFAMISQCVGTRSREQCKIFFSKARKCLGLDVIHQGTSNGGMPMSDTNGGRSDTDDACAAEMDSAICSTQSCSKMDADVSQSVANISSEGFVHAARTPLQAETDKSSEQDVVGGINLEEDEGKVDKQASVLHDDKLGSEGDNPQSMQDVDAALRCNASVQHEAVGCVDAEMKMEGSSPIVSPGEPVFTVCMEVESKSHIDGVVEKKETGGSADVLKKEVDVSLPVPETGSRNRQLMVDLGATNGGTICSTSDSKADPNALHLGNKVDDCPRSTVAPIYPHQMPLDLLPCLQNKSQGISLMQENSHSVPSNSVLPDPSSARFEGPLLATPQATLNFEDHGNKRHKNPVARDLYPVDQPLHMMRNPSLKQVDQPMCILRGYPLQVLNQEVKKEADPLISENAVFMESHPKRNGVSQSGQFFISEMYSDHCNGSSLSHSRPGVLFPPRNEAQPEAQLKHSSQNSCSEPEEQAHRTGDVKLFGQIICHPSSSQKSSSSLHECNSKPSSPQVNRSSTLKSSNGGKAGTLFASRPGSSGHGGLGELPLRSYGLWDGSRKQAGFSSLPESAVMLAKYPGSLAGMSFYSGKDSVPSRNRILTDYQQTYMQHLSSDEKRLQSFCELQKRNGIETVSGFQQQGRVPRLGSNMVGGGILGGGGGVSDPVAALKMHYAARAKVLSGELESWRGGDIGGR
ncbi:uncharacterized protein [Elaeis guineensis]|uniref:Uncharacterized protein LOC105057083 isoform X1 n=1 Tax=Elaeis guineensis var. tenera TaxID=51953 RepID=A0A6I9S5A8_ELAGV|nr:uncharacterized protein LOC105057083 isoform X1 [Elaeis guineensis]